MFGETQKAILPHPRSAQDSGARKKQSISGFGKKGRAGGGRFCPGRRPRLKLVPFLMAGVLLSAGCARLPKQLTAVERLSKPPPGKALVNFYRPSDKDWHQNAGIFDGNGTLLIELPHTSEYQHVCEPGEHLFVGYLLHRFGGGGPLKWVGRVSVMKAAVAADSVYDVVVDEKLTWLGDIELNPVGKDDQRRRKVGKYEKSVRWVVTLNRPEQVRRTVTINQPQMEDIKRDFLGGGKSARLRHLRREDCR